nr:MAG TPA: hypothetical protein [Caudoviricetes sp.]DAS75153.1 MAG TPA: hypothetical protein [Caudoviricetes sp.]
MVKGNLRMKPPFRKKHILKSGMCFLFVKKYKNA